MATALYNNMNMRKASDDCRPTFKFLQPWCILRENHKFMMEILQGDQSNEDQRLGEGVDGLVEDDSTYSTSIGYGGAKRTELNINARPTGHRKAEDNAARDGLV